MVHLIYVICVIVSQEFLRVEHGGGGGGFQGNVSAMSVHTNPWSPKKSFSLKILNFLPSSETTLQHIHVCKIFCHLMCHWTLNYKNIYCLYFGVFGSHNLDRVTPIDLFIKKYLKDILVKTFRTSQRPKRQMTDLEIHPDVIELWTIHRIVWTILICRILCMCLCVTGTSMYGTRVGSSDPICQRAMEDGRHLTQPHRKRVKVCISIFLFDYIT